MLRMCVCMHSRFVENHPIWILKDEPLIFGWFCHTRELDFILLEERRNTALIYVQKYHESLKKYYNKSVVQQELNIGDLVLKKDICTRDKHKFLSP
jgi:hypothetical protein